jgi:spore coat protein CotH
MEFDRFIRKWLKIRGCTFSDVDITLLGYGLTLSHLNRLSAEIDESSLPYQFDISIFFKTY